MRRASAAPWLLNVFVVSVLANALLGIWALLSSDFGETQGKILGTSFLVSAATLSVLVNVPGLRRRTLWPTPLVGAVAGATGFCLFIVLVWTEPEDSRWFKLTGSILVVAAAATLAASLALIVLAPHWRWLQPAGNALIALLAVTVVTGLWVEPDVGWYARLLGVEGVLVAATTLLIPVLARFAISDADDGFGPTWMPEVRFCPWCGGPVQPPVGASATTGVCPTCGLGFEVRTGR